MKDSEFIALLNLYLDHEISPADAARLEGEVQSNPSRRSVYQDYCRMQKACKMLAQDFATDATPAPKDNVVAFKAAQTVRAGRNAIWYVGAGVAAAAACVALVFVGRTQQGHATPGSGEVAQVVPVASNSSQSVAVSETVRHGIEKRSATPHVSAPAASLSLTASIQNDPNFAWLQEVRLAPVQAPTTADQLRFDAPTVLRPENRTFNSSNKALPPDVQSIAIRFQR